MPRYALVDCANFYVSCEQVFNPSLRRRPVVVLSNNDGCVISRSREAKEAGIPMGAPYFQVRDLLNECNGAALSSNYALYGDMSRRVMSILATFSPVIEVYSIDEAFLEFREAASETAVDAEQVREAVRRQTGIPVGVGVGETKTLAKLANRFAKKHAEGFFDLGAVQNRDQLLAQVSVGEVWGIGRRLAARLGEEAILTARQLRDMPDQRARGMLGVVGLRTVYELRGISCLTMETCPQPKQSIACTRSFSAPVTTLDYLKNAATHFVTRAAEKLRKQGSAAGVVTAYVLTDRFKNDPYFRAATATLPVATADTLALGEYARQVVERIYREGRKYKKLGVILTELTRADSIQLGLFAQPDSERSRKLMQTVDQMNRRFGQGTVLSAATLHRPWQGRCEHRSDRYTTRWEELLMVW